MEHKDRGTAWRNIWIKKGLDKEASLHVADGYDLLSADEFDRMVVEVTRPIGLSGNESILECGCGAGAFLASLRKIHPGLKVAGVDYSPALLDRARESLDGEFFLADMTDLRFLADDRYDHTMSFGAIYYLSSEERARRAVAEMVRITRPGGTVYVGEVPDAAKRVLAEEIRRVSHKSVKRLSSANPDHLYLPKQFFQSFVPGWAADVKIIDHSELDLGGYQAARYRYSVYMTKKDGKAK